MKTLERFWHWAANEKPGPGLFDVKAGELLSETAECALRDAAAFVTERGLGKDFETNLEDYVYCLQHHAVAFREMSLSLCRALEAMHAAVPEGAGPNPWRPIEPETPWWRREIDHTADALLHSLTGVSEMHRATRKETLDRYAGMFEGTPVIELLREQNRVLDEIDRSERLRPQGIIFYDPDRVSESLRHDDYEIRPMALMGCPRPGTVIKAKPAPERLHWVSLTGCPGCGCSNDSGHMDTCPMIGASDGKWARALVIQAEQRELAACDQPRDLTVPPTGRIIPE